MADTVSPPSSFSPMAMVLPTSPMARMWTRFLPCVGCHAAISRQRGWSKFTARRPRAIHSAASMGGACVTEMRRLSSHDTSSSAAVSWDRDTAEKAARPLSGPRRNRNTGCSAAPSAAVSGRGWQAAKHWPFSS